MSDLLNDNVAESSSSNDSIQSEQITQSVSESSGSFLNSLPEDLRSDPSLKDIKDITGLAKSHINAQKLIGNSLRIPTSDASPEQLEEFYKKLESVDGVLRAPSKPEDFDRIYETLGRPSKAEGYQLDVEAKVKELGLGAELDEFKNFAHKMGLNQQQANELATAQLTSQVEALEKQEVIKKTAEDTLRKQWGPDYDARLAGAKSALKHIGDKYPEMTKELVGGPGGNNPVLITLLSEYGKFLKESGAIKNSDGVQYGTSSDEAKAQLEDIYKNNVHAYWNGNDPSHKAAVEKVRKLSVIAYGD